MKSKSPQQEERETREVFSEKFLVNSDVAQKYKGYNLVVYADTINVKSYKNAGCDLTLVGRKILTDNTSVIDLSGPSAKGYSKRAASGTDDTNPDGKNGLSGRPGMNGGHLTTLAMDLSAPPMIFRSVGGKGGCGQNGGNGAKGAKGRPGRDARPRTDKYFPKVEGLGGTVDIGDSPVPPCYYIAAISGDKGKTGAKGGNAGLAGISGNGGNGGNIRILYRNSLSQKPTIRIKGGAPGGLGACGKPGPGGDGGDGGKNLYHYFVTADPWTWAIPERWLPADSPYGHMGVWQNPNHCRSFLSFGHDYLTQEGKLSIRSAKKQGESGFEGGFGPEGLPEAPPAQRGRQGRPGTRLIQKVSGDASLPAIPLKYILKIRQSADVSFINNERETACQKFTWLAFITRPVSRKTGNTVKTDQDALTASIHCYALNQIQKINRGFTYYSLPAHTFKCNNIKLYQDYVDHVMVSARDIETRYLNFLDTKKSKAEKKKAILESINTYEILISHLTDDINDKDAKLKAINHAVAQLNRNIEEYRLELIAMPEKLQWQILKKASEDAFGWKDVIDIVSLGIGVTTSAVSVSKELKSVLDLLKKGVEIAVALKKLKDSGSAIYKGMKTIALNGYRIFTIVQGGSPVNHPDFVYPDTGGRDVLLVPKMQKLEFLNAKEEFEYQMADYMEFSEAKKWKHLFMTFLQTAETKVDLATQAATVYQEKSEFTFQREQLQSAMALLRKKLQEYLFDPNDEDITVPLELSYMAALRSATYRVIDEWTAYRIWTLKEDSPPKLDDGLTVVKLADNVHQPIYEKIQEYLMDIERQASEFEAAPVIWRRKDYPEIFEKLKLPEHRVYLELPMDEQADFRNIRLKQISVFLAGATSDSSHIYCELTHSGNCRYTSIDGTRLDFVLPRRKIPCGYRILDGKPDFSILKTVLMNHPYDLGYSLSTAYELYIPESLSPCKGGQQFNTGIDFDAISEIRLMPVFYFNPRANALNRRYKELMLTRKNDRDLNPL